MESGSAESSFFYKSRSSILNRSDTSKPKMPKSDCIILKNNMEKITQLKNTIGGYDKLLSDLDLGKIAVQYKKASMEKMELLKTCSKPTTSYNTCRRPFYDFYLPKEKKDLSAATCCRPPCSIRDKNIRYDEAQFWLNGYVNKQNCRIWSEANPQVYVETPLHPEKLTVWCALWAGGILLQKR
ncbi:hypothetical protein TNCV_204311 [Trichonephila clavipes]|nr:hypothetical protein TNCV_204311 [Trichonephila clavipes]